MDNNSEDTFNKLRRTPIAEMQALIPKEILHHSGKPFLNKYGDFLEFIKNHGWELEEYHKTIKEYNKNE